MEVRFTGPARRALHSLPPRILPAVLKFAYGDLAEAPYRVGKPLSRDLAGLLSARRGPYRILYRVVEEARRIDVIDVEHRSEVYRPR